MKSLTSAIGLFVICLSALQLVAQQATAIPTSQPTPTVVSRIVVEALALPSVDPIDIAGDIAIAGSSTVFPLTEKMIERFEEDGYTDQINDESIGTGAGFERFCIAGDTDISNASRAIRDTEIEACKTIGRMPLEFRVGTDALVVVVSQENVFLEDLTLEELALAFSTAKTWKDVRAEFPNEPIYRYVPGTESGTFDFFVEEVFDNDNASLLAAERLQLSEDDNVLVRGVESKPGAIGFFGFAYFQENADLLRAVNINSITPDEATAEDGTYPLARPLFIYSDATILQENPQVAAFVNYYLTHVNEDILEVGYFPASIEALNTAKQTFLDALSQ